MQDDISGVQVCRPEPSVHCVFVTIHTSIFGEKSVSQSTELLVLKDSEMTFSGGLEILNIQTCSPPSGALP